MKLKFLLAVLLSVIVIYAQETNERQTLALELLRVSDVKNMLINMTDEMVNLQIKNKPELLDYKETMRSFILEKLTSDSVISVMAGFYAEAFTDDELNKLIKFYESELGKKVIAQTPDLTVKCMNLGRDIVIDNMDELIDLINARRNELLLSENNIMEFKTFIADDSSFSIELPQNWVTDLQIVEGAKLQAGSIKDGILILVLSESKDSVLDDNDFLTAMSEQLNHFDVADSGKVIEDDYVKSYYAFSGDNGGVDLSYYYVKIEEQSIVYHIICWTSTDVYDVVEDFFLKSVNSFRIYNN